MATPHALASEAGLAVLKRGGNAVDAAIAAGAAIAVVYPHMNGVGGDSFWLIYDGRHRRLRALNAAGRSAASADTTTTTPTSASSRRSRPRIAWPTG